MQLCGEVTSPRLQPRGKFHVSMEDGLKALVERRGKAGSFLDLHILCLRPGRCTGASGEQMDKGTLQKLLAVILIPASFLTRVGIVLRQKCTSCQLSVDVIPAHWSSCNSGEGENGAHPNLCHSIGPFQL